MSSTGALLCMALTLASNSCTAFSFHNHHSLFRQDVNNADVYHPKSWKRCRGETSCFATSEDDTPTSSSPAAEAGETAEDEALEEFPGLLSEEEIRTMLDAVPVYAVTGTNQEGIVLVKEQGNDNDVANFFFSSEMASSFYAPLLQAKLASGEQVSWGIAKFTLGFVWFNVLKNPPVIDDSCGFEVIQEGVEYRLVPDSRELAGAKSINSARAQMKGRKANPNMFGRAYNEIPIFMDLKLRDSSSKLPMCLGLQDLVKIIQESGDGEYKAEINIEDLHSIIQEMQKETTAGVDFRQVSLVAPTFAPPQRQQEQEQGQ